MNEMKDVPSRARFNHPTIKHAIIGDFRISTGKSRLILLFHTELDARRDTHLASPCHTTRHPFNQRVSESALVEIKESRLRLTPEIVAGGVLIAFAISEKRTGVGFDDGCDVRDLVLDAGLVTDVERRENLTVGTDRVINLIRRNKRQARLGPGIMVKLQWMRSRPQSEPDLSILLIAAHRGCVQLAEQRGMFDQCPLSELRVVSLHSVYRIRRFSVSQIFEHDQSMFPVARIKTRTERWIMAKAVEKPGCSPITEQFMRGILRRLTIREVAHSVFARFFDNQRLGETRATTLYMATYDYALESGKHTVPNETNVLIELPR